MNFRLIAIIFYLSSFLNPGFAQGIIKGKVFDNNTLEPLNGVYVMISSTRGDITGDDGTFILRSENEKTDITFRFIGYQSLTKSVIVSGKDTTEINVGLDVEIKEIGQIVVSANKTEQKVAELTVSMNIIKPVDFFKTHISSSEELINKTSGIEVLDGQASIRGGSGFSYGVGSRVLALIDGLPVLAPDAGNIKWQFLPLENISQVEIIKGASSVLYGSSALNGVINFRTADPANVPETRFYAETGIYGKPANKDWVWWNSPLIFTNLSLSHLQKIGKTDLGLGINILSDKGYRRLNDEKLGRFSLRLKHHSEKIRGLVYGVNLNSGYTAKRDFVLWEDADRGALKQDTSSVSLLHGSFFAIDPYLSLNNKGRFKHDLRVRIQSSNNRFPVRQGNNSNAFSFYTEYQGYCRISDFMSLIAGLSENYTKVTSNFYGDHEGINIAGFTQLEANLLPRLKLIGGIRIEQNILDGKSDRFVPIVRTGINWQAADYTFLRASFGEGQRYPSIAEKHASTTLGSVKIFPNPYVRPESGWSSEIGIKQGIVIGKTNGQADFSLFLSQNNDLIEYVFSNYPDPVTGIFDYGFQATNVEQSRVYGYEVEFVLNRSQGQLTSTLTGGYTYIYPVEFNPSTNRKTGAYLKYRRKHSAKISINSSYKNLDMGLTLFAKSRILSIDDVFVNELTRETILPGFYGYWLQNNTGYLLLDGNLGYKINEILTISVAVKNITNTEYMGRPGDIQPQRNFSLRLAGEF
jgi:iron complex outermembrane receptor protein